ESFNILFDGRVPVCCWDYNVDIVNGGLGNVCERTIGEIWQSEPLRLVRLQHSRLDFGALPRCAACTMVRVPEATAPYPGTRTRFGVVRPVEVPSSPSTLN